MASDVKCIYRGYEITYNENTEEWNCYDINSSYSSSGSSPKLAAIKARIDKMLVDMRKAEAVEAFVINASASSEPSKTNCMVTEYVGTDRNGYTRDAPFEPKVATMALRRGNNKPSRQELFINNLMPNTKEALEAYEDALAAYRAVKAARAVYQERLNAIPRLSLEDIPGLVEVYKIQHPEKEKAE